MHATMIEVPAGTDLLDWLKKSADEVGYLPLVVLSGMGMLSKAVLNVPNDEALPEILDAEKPFGVTVIDEFPDLPFAMTSTLEPFEGEIGSPSLEEVQQKPHWASVQTFNHPLSLLYAHGGRRREVSKPEMHLIVSGSDTRTTGISETFVGELLPGCIAMTPLHFVVGIAATTSKSTVQGWTVSVEPGYDIIETLHLFLKRRTVGKCFIFSATGKLGEADLVNVNESGEDETLHMPGEQGPYHVEGLSGILNNGGIDVRVHAAVVHNCSEPPCDSAGGRLTRGIVSSEAALDFYVGEMTRERDIFEPL